MYDLKDMESCGDEADIALLLARANVGAQQPADAGSSPSRWSWLQGKRTWLLLVGGGALLGCSLWLALTERWPAEALVGLLRLPVTLLAALGLTRGAEPGLWETAQLWLASMVYGVLCWLPGICSSGEPVSAGSLWTLAQKLSPL
ncbi:uncharacterized protein LOC119108491 [Pollicipes pollicipes]|nr:uncharacterized protein LOC119108491 [Pollicipes pollicipes]